ncbi:ATP-binding sensor histidine kinase [Planktothrix sp. FACHB-1365]|uniref:trifunctional serine/threonine-protein kinase/ATP-binding protein/sensor histidine kinase n=1 Tax=Planktothrix sp. FACHB-1365 TaxID=2692855 RepID=UPI001686D063|nr:ATP-binding sensor histidine kinase [Planktothrix sp. FACHB-1365]MBD2481216.1 AAA family ATPase [Planktothrix sp. FACHB-1365]
MIALPGYQILAQIYESINSVVYRAIREKDNLPVILKVLQGEFPSQSDLQKYEREYKILRCFNLESVIKVYELQTYQNTLVMALEDFGGESLKILLATQKFTLLGFLNIAIKIAQGLREIHAANLIHKDINPSNIVFNPATGQVKLIDFSISSGLTQDSLRLHPPQNLEGTLAYISPEQTGRMNRSVDYRTDFYSLGATFYELLTQQVPFPTGDAMEVVHAHLAKQPIPPHEINPEIPPIISEIVLKLLSKTAEERYQSAWGLIADLEKSLKQVQATGTVSQFPLGMQDISDQFKIPKKLYGREIEIDTLMQAFDRVSQGKTEMMLIAGYSGIGKSVLVQEISKSIIDQHGYFISGKFDQFQRSIPYSALVSAFSELARLLLSETQQRLDQWREKLLEILGPNGQIIIDVIPEIELIIGTQPPVLELGSAESQNRFNLVFQNFIRLFCQPEHPLVIFLDDLQWADSATLKLIKLMLTDDSTPYLFLIGAYRDNEVNPTHPLMMMLEALKSESFTLENQQHSHHLIHEIHLTALNLEQVTELLADTLHSDRTTVQPLAELVLGKTAGNPFFVNEFFKTLYQEKLLTFNSERIAWQWDLDEIKALDITDNVVELMIGKLQKLPLASQQVLQLVACVGNQFDLNTLSLIYGKESLGTFQDLLPALKEGLIKPLSDADNLEPEQINPYLVLNYKFLHDRVQQAAYSLIANSQKQSVHLTIGRLLLANTPPQYWLERVFDLVDHLNVGRSLITDEQEQLQLASLNLEAGKKAKDATAYSAAREYLMAGIETLPGDIWVEHYPLAFVLYREQAEVEYLNGNFAESETLIQLILEKSQSILEKAEVYNLLLIQYTLQLKYESALNAGIKALALLGLDIPTNNLQTVISQELESLQNQLNLNSLSSLVHQSPIVESESKIILKLLNNLAPSAYVSNPSLWTVIILNGVKVALKSGYSPEAGFFYATYGILLATLFNQYQTAYELGQLALKLNKKWNYPIYKVAAALISCLNYWLEPLKSSNALGHEGYQSALESGDLQYASYLLNNQSLNLMVQGVNLPKFLVEVKNYLKFSKKAENQLVIDSLTGLGGILLNLIGETPNLLSFDSLEMTEVDYLKSSQDNQKFYSLCLYQIFKIQVLYLYGEVEQALQLVKETEPLLQFIIGLISVTEYYFYSSLTFIANLDRVSASEQKELLEKIKSNQEKFKQWSENCPANFWAKYLLIEAELARFSQRSFEAIDLYEQAISTAQEAGLIQNVALSHELTAKFWMTHGKVKYANLHLREAYYSYQRWGAIRKVEQLETEYPQLKQLGSLKSSLFEAQSITLNTSHGSRLALLDLSTVIKASQAISREIVLERLLGNLMKIVIENAGAQKGFLILYQGEKLVIEAEASTDIEDVIVHPKTPVETCNCLPLTVIYYVERTGQDVVLMNATLEGQFTHDSYINAHHVKSILCTPIISQGKLLGILYLENNLTAGAFTSERIEVLNLLSSQAAVSLENALLYASVENKVQERTQEINEKNLRLEQALTQLQRTQAQLIQSEKMSSLGQMVAGVAHEINNPVSFIYGNLTPASEYVKDLLRLIQVYQQEYPQPKPLVEETILDIDLEFLVEDLQKLLVSMKVGAERIRNIVLSLRNFSRLDEAEMKPVDIHEGIDSTLMILQPRLRASTHSGEIEIIKQYGQLPKVNCYVSQLNQVFMNIISNGIDALEHRRNLMNPGDTLPTITISTCLIDNNKAKISILDNGSGMSPDILQRIFDPFFTTKPVGSGTGLGLSISYSIIVDRHQGEMSCTSTLGEGTEFTILIPIH